MSRALDDLSPRMRPLAIELLARCIEAGIMVMIVDTLRTPAEQAENLRKGVSWTLKSRHLTGNAIDIAPYETYALHGPDKLQWDNDDAVWQRIGDIGESLGLTWGGRWKQHDMGHFELKP
jgi:peptidoglycan L-alanyl-D-glutamate endopeptidase CwlK